MKDKTKKNVNNNGSTNNYYLFLIFFMIIISFPIYNQNKLGRLIFDSEIIVTIKGKNNQQILNNKTYYLENAIIQLNQNYKFDYKPSEILVNGIKINKVDYYVYNLEEEENNITIKFNKTLKNCSVMFYGLSNLTKINFTNFDSSEVTNMDYMFYNCSNLISLDLTNFNTKSVAVMGYMFFGCSNLIYLDLSNFDTTSTTSMGHMFTD